MAFSIANAGAASRGYQRGIDMRLDRERMAGIEQRAEERHGIDMGDADYRAKSRLPADEALASKRGDISWTDETRGYTRGSRAHEEGARKPVEAIQARHAFDDQSARNAEGRAQSQEGRANAAAGRAAASFADAMARRVPPEMERANAMRAAELQEAEDRFQAEMAPLVQAGKKQEAAEKFMQHHENMNMSLIATMVELGPQAAVAALNAWPGNKVSNAADVRQIDTPDGPMYAVVDEKGEVIIDPTTKKPMQFSEQEMKGSYARHQALKAGKGRKNTKTVKGPGGAEVLVDADTGQEIGRVEMDEQGNPRWVPAGGADPARGGSARPPGAPNPAIGEGPQPPPAHIDKLREAMNAGDPELRKLRQQQFDAVYGQGAAMHWMGQIDSKQKATAAREQQKSQREQQQQEAVRDAQALLKVVDGPGIAPRGPDEPATREDAVFVEFFEAKRDLIEAADRGTMLEMLGAYRNAKARLDNAPKQPDKASQGRDEWLKGIDAPPLPGISGSIAFPER